MKNIRNIFLVFSALFIGACDPDLLDVPNENNPDFQKVYAKGEDVENVASNLFNTYYHGEHNNNGVKPMLAVASDNVTASHGNFGMWHASSEPRDLAWDNSPSYSNQNQTKYSYDKMYGAIATANNVIKALESGVKIGRQAEGNDRTMAVARFIQGISYGNLALVYDRAHVVDEKNTVEGILETAIPYNEVATKAVEYLDQAITLSNSNFSIPPSWFASGTALSNADFKKIVSTVAARILANVPRNKTELAAVNWAKVKAYADAGITTDWNVVFDGGTLWYDQGSQYLTTAGWGKADMYVIHMMDPKQPQIWENRPDFPHPPASTNPIDKRLNLDFQYTASNGFRPDRGYFNFSNYRHARYDHLFVNHSGPKAHILKTENDMLRAEARVYLGELAEAAAIINASTRTTRGEMPPVAANKEDLLKAIHHEIHVECHVSSGGLQFFHMRKQDLLQKGTFLHFPIPARTLETLRVNPPFYTFGTVAKADGKGTSNGGWK